MARSFRSPMTLSTSQRTSTLTAVLVVAVPLFVTLVLAHGVAALLSALGLGSLGIGWAMAPRAVVVEAGELRIERRGWPAVRVPLASIEAASAMERLEPATSRVAGVGGFFGSYGLFESAKLGQFRMYATREREAVLLVRRGKELPLVITPDDAAGAVAWLGCTGS